MDHSRIDDLRRRIERDPASIAFAQLAEEYRRAGDYQTAIHTCRTGLAQHPAYLSARVTLGRALMELGALEEAESELTYVLRAAPDNLSAIRALAELHQRRLERKRSADLLEEEDAARGSLTRTREPWAPPEPAHGPAASPPRPAEGPVDPALQELERWLEAILADRTARTSDGHQRAGSRTE